MNKILKCKALAWFYLLVACYLAMKLTKINDQFMLVSTLFITAYMAGFTNCAQQHLTLIGDDEYEAEEVDTKV